MRDIGIGAVYFLACTAGMALIASGFAVVYPLGQWAWTWVWSGFDMVKAAVDMDYAARGGALTPHGMAIFGAFWGAWIGLIPAGNRWLNGNWPHEPDS